MQGKDDWTQVARNATKLLGPIVALSIFTILFPDFRLYDTHKETRTMHDDYNTNDYDPTLGDGEYTVEYDEVSEYEALIDIVTEGVDYQEKESYYTAHE